MGTRCARLAGARGVTRESLAAAPAWLERVGLWLEVHIEQGVALVDVPAALGVASGLAPRERWRATFEGSANHAGTTPMAGRRDALVAAARTIVASEALAAAEPGAVATVGRVEAHPGASNVIPGESMLTLDVRARDGAALARVRDGSSQRPTARTGSRCPGAASRRTRAPCSTAACRDVLARAASHLGVPAPELWAYAGHDAGVLARHVPAAMLFVRNPTGVSHHPDELAAEDDCLAGCAVLASALAELVAQR